jgi:hypothetical protein
MISECRFMKYPTQRNLIYDILWFIQRRLAISWMSSSRIWNPRVSKSNIFSRNTVSSIGVNFFELAGILHCDYILTYWVWRVIYRTSYSLTTILIIKLGLFFITWIIRIIRLSLKEDSISFCQMVTTGRVAGL